eukprot:GHVN01081823.1.p2 GENE.GHVN01081823.1~~GHVN01081823.1.p2  ORF type:complete len:202 (+),score=37.18 GHVN01081823.1:1814-2419(+)
MAEVESPKNDEDNFVEEAELTEGNWNTPQVDVKEVDVITGEEDEELFWNHRAKLFRWAKDSNEWKQRGLGDARLLKHKTTGKIRFLLRQDKTLKIVANHYVFQQEDFCKLVPNCGSEKIWVWTVYDFAEDEIVREQFALKFGQVEQANIFKEKFEEATEINAVLFNVSKTDNTPKSSESAEESPGGKEAATGETKESEEKE